MRLCSFPSLLLSLLAALTVQKVQAKETGLEFIANGRQWPQQIRYKADVQGGSVFLTPTGFTYSYYSTKDLNRVHELRHGQKASPEAINKETINCHAYSVTLVGCDKNALCRPSQELPNYYNYFLGNDSTRWAGAMAAYERVSYERIYKGIDLHVYSKGSSLKYDFVLARGANTASIQLAFEGVTPTLTPGGDLMIRTSVNEVLEKAPYAYQMVNGRQRAVACRYILQDGKVGFAFPNGYDHTRELVIDPVLIFLTYSGGTVTTFGWSATFDSSGNLYAGGETFGTGWPITLGAYQSSFGGIEDVGINKYNASGTTLLYSSFYGGDGPDDPNSMLVNSAGELILAGATGSTNLPVTSGCFDNSFNGGLDLYVAHFNAAGSALIGATYLGGTGTEGNISTTAGVNANRGEIVTDTAGNIYVAFASNSTNFPVSSGAFQTSLSGTLDAVVAKLNSSCSSLLFGTYIGGSGTDAAITMQMDNNGNLLIGGATNSSNFPATSGGWQSSLQGGLDGFIAVLNNQGTALSHATYVGTAGDDEVAKLYRDINGNVFATGYNNPGAFPVSAGVYSAPNARNYIASFDSTLSTKQVSTTVGDSSVLFTPTAFMVDKCSNVYFIGFGNPHIGLPLTSDAFQTSRANFWMCVLNPGLASIRYASYFGALGDHIDGGSSRLNPDGIMYHSLCTSSFGLPTTPSAWSTTKKTSSFDIASWKFAFQYAGMAASFTISPDDSICAPGVVTFKNTSTGALSYLWDFGDGTPTSTLADPPPHTYSSVGTYKVRLYSYNVASCQLKDSAFRFVYVYRVRDSVKLIAPDPVVICAGDTTKMKVDPKWNVAVVPATNVKYKPLGGTEILFYPGANTSYEVSAYLNGPCGVAVDTIRFEISLDTSALPAPVPMTDTALCRGDTAVYKLAYPMSRISISPAGFYAISSDSMSVRFFPQVSTRYRLIGQTSNKCMKRNDTLSFTIHRSTVKAAFELSPKESDMLAPQFRLDNQSKNAVSYNWYLNNSFWTTTTSPTFTAKDTGLYCFRLEARDALNCVDTASDCGRIFTPIIYIPTAFTPNGDDKNDIFRPVSRNLQIMEFSVYNRYGQRVFVAFDNKKGWDGTFNGDKCDLGTYFYLVRYRILERDPVLLKGDVTLVR